MWIFMTIMSILTPVIMIIFGNYFRIRIPKKINHFFGYRTSMSMKNKDTWDFAHKHIGKVWNTGGFILLFASIIAMLFVFGKDEETVGKFATVIILSQCVILLLSLIPTEIALRKTFDKYGKRK